jgi:hypothetical protein
MFNGSGVVNGPALTVTGVTNQGGLLVNISSTEMLTGVGGQSPAVRPVDGNTPNLTVALQDPNKFMQSLIFNLHNEGNQTTSTVKLTATDQFGQTSFTEIVNNGENWMGMIGTGGSFITNASVQVLSSSTGSTDVLDQMNQIRVSAVTSTGGPIPGPPGGSGGGAGGLETPLPGSWLLWSALTAGLLFWWGASKRRPALAGAA